MKRLLLLALIACNKTTPTPAPKPEPVADAAAPTTTPPEADAAPEAAAPSSAHLSIVTKPGKDDAQVCLVVDDAGKKIGHASSRNTAAGGSDVVCDRFTADGKVIIFTNSRGTYAKDGRPGPKNDQSLPCGEGAFANDVSSCIQLDTSPFSYTPGDPKAENFTISMADIATGKEVSLVTIPHGLGRAPSDARPWDATYCTNDRAVVVAKGELALFDAPGGKALAHVPAKGATRVECKDGIVSINKPTRRFRLDGAALTSLED